MADEEKKNGDEAKAETPAVEKAAEKPADKPAAAPAKVAPAKAVATAPAADEHYEVVSEYRIGEGPPPLFLVVCFFFIVLWAMFSWIPFFGY
ncbi:MAG TPA: hypothetical protein EYN91_14745 [Candidatus Melainabacteria bacterium]|jgi:hypothetical protein|nr:hypothetical protein [Candidatus Melainabacteria bacterium]HIN66005.1 hypothetical protein [Candidatus Obscuribacterales bacterium]